MYIYWFIIIVRPLQDEKAENKEETVLGVGETREDAIKLDE